MTNRNLKPGYYLEIIRIRSNYRNDKILLHRNTMEEIRIATKKYKRLYKIKFLGQVR